IEVLRQERRACDDLLEIGILAVEDAKRIALQPLQAVGIQTRLVGREIRNELLTVCAARLRRAERIQVELEPLESEFSEQASAQHDQLGIDVRPRVAEGFDIELVKLA